MSAVDLVGRGCRALVAREFWLSGKLVNAFCIVFIEDDRGESWSISLDDEDYTWKLERSQEVPRPGTSDGDGGFFGTR